MRETDEAQAVVRALVALKEWGPTEKPRSMLRATQDRVRWQHKRIMDLMAENERLRAMLRAMADVYIDPDVLRRYKGGAVKMTRDALVSYVAIWIGLALCAAALIVEWIKSRRR